MSKTFRPWNPDQDWLLPPSPKDWLPQGDLIYFLLDVVRELDLSAIVRDYEQEVRGYPPFDPRMMVTLLLYAYCRGIYSSRGIMRACQEQAGFRVVVADDVPDFRTISDFRKRHLPALSGLFLQVLRLCQEAGLVRLGHVALDGTKMRANASRHKAMSYGRMKQEETRLQEEIKGMLAQAEQSDAQEDALYGERRGDDLPVELARRETRLERIRAAKKALEAEAQVSAKLEQERRDEQQRDRGDKRPPGRSAPPIGKVPPDKQQYNFTDPDSRIMKTGDGFQQCVNALSVVDDAHQIVVSCEVSNQPNDQPLVLPLMQAAQENVGPHVAIRAVTMDNGCYSDQAVLTLGEQKMDVYAAAGKMSHGAGLAPGPRGRCPAGLTIRQRMARKLRTVKGRRMYARRKWTIEPVFGQVKGARGFRQFLLRGLRQMRGEWSLLMTTHNLRKLWAATVPA